MSASESERGERAGAFIHAMLLTVDPGRAETLVQSLEGTARDTLSRIRGFRTISVLLSDDRSRIVVLSEWAELHDWARAEWHEKIQDLIVDLHSSSLHVDSHSYALRFRLEASA